MDIKFDNKMDEINAELERPPHIVCAAMLMDDGLIVTGVRHFSPDMRAVLHRIYGDKYHLRVKEQGFITHQYQFIGREDAAKEVRKNKQAIREPLFNTVGLFSENLY